LTLEFYDLHPAAATIFDDCAGTDATAKFKDYHQDTALLNDYTHLLMGRVVERATARGRPGRREVEEQVKFGEKRARDSDSDSDDEDSEKEARPGECLPCYFFFFFFFFFFPFSPFLLLERLPEENRHCGCSQHWNGWPPLWLASEI
jgi:hypothetical protein